MSEWRKIKIAEGWTEEEIDKEYLRLRRVKSKEDGSTAKYLKKTKKHRREIYVENKYGLKPNVYRQMLKKQHNKCAICGGDFGNREPHVDHCHSNGFVRGILCSACNVALGNARDDINILWSMIEYLNASKLFQGD